jgi:RNA polymerase sigma-70 factor (ECF subfamily)
MKNQKEELIPTRVTLLNRLKDWRDQPSWQDFFNTYWKLIYGVARKGGLTDAEAQDVVQETLISVAKHIAAFKYDPSVGSFKAWLLNMTRWRMIGQLRKRKPFVEPQSGKSSLGTDIIEKVIDPHGQPLDDLWEAEWQTNLLNTAVANVRRRISDDHYKIFDSYVNQGSPPEEVAARFNVSIGQVYKIKHRLTEAFRAEVARLEKEMT